MCGSVRHRDAETTRNKLRTNKSHLQIVGQNRMNRFVRDASVFFQLHDGHSSIILNQLSHFFNHRNSGNFLTALRIAFPLQQWLYESPSVLHYTYTVCLVRNSRNYRPGFKQYTFTHNRRGIIVFKGV